MMKRLSKIMLWLAAVGLLVPQVTPVAAAGPGGAGQVPIQDVALTDDGLLRGQLLDRAGTPKAATELTARTGQQLVDATTTDQQGRFAMRLTKGGVYQLSDGENAAVLRVWTADSAPPAAKTSVLMVSGTEIARGNMGQMNTATLVGLGLIGVATAAVVWAVFDDDDAS